ncbi:hypothetical protein PPERSA_02314 [Pseudocohnilembus persalinus]|uniref:Insulin-like growth factor binding protein, N-terminal n=1 Tax=Pseudocohnilembus persalinus TaxID=266149 RepID=A0A0V0QUD4_PSEPJ|nr:hypothetical protein PPERSA_02314 [Pseudocohnilembus persalinus]|eukprot:KRX05782.1 hypothetical protein PPERSA_02314 [Pseudocohnilembus persalinus]
MNKNIISLLLVVLISLSSIQAGRVLESDSQGSCYISQCGCPGSFIEDWCSSDSQLVSTWCQEKEENCAQCDGVWCSDDDSQTDEDQEASEPEDQDQDQDQDQEQDQDQDQDEDQVSTNGTCFIEQCGCPGEFKLDYCNETNVLPAGFCQENADNCEGCAGVCR